jgi:hypothetical protein
MAGVGQKKHSHSTAQRCVVGLYLHQDFGSLLRYCQSHGSGALIHIAGQQFPLGGHGQAVGLAGAALQKGRRGLGVSCVAIRGQTSLAKQFCHQVARGEPLGPPGFLVGQSLERHLSCPGWRYTGRSYSMALGSGNWRDEGPFSYSGVNPCWQGAAKVAAIYVPFNYSPPQKSEIKMTF